MRIADYGVQVGSLPRGARNKITDVPGVRVGHATIHDERHHTGVTVILPCADNMFKNKLTAASFVLNGFGKTQGLVQIDELGTLETPIALTNTLNVGKVHDALVEYMTGRCEQDGVSFSSINPVVGECNDAAMNAIHDRVVEKAHVLAAIEGACADFAEGAVGAGRGTTCHGLKGGIGSASRIIPIAGRDYTLGVLVQSNHGTLEELHVGERAIGREIIRARRSKPEAEPTDRGSIIMVVATVVAPVWLVARYTATSRRLTLPTPSALHMISSSPAVRPTFSLPPMMAVVAGMAPSAQGMSPPRKNTIS